MESLWEQTWKQPNFPAQDGDMNTDVLIIGGGMAGVLCAYQLHWGGVPYVLAEAEQYAATSRKIPPPRLPARVYL